MTTETSTGWAVPDFPHDPVEGRPGLEVVDGAILTRVRRGRLRTILEPTAWVRGAVHDGEGRLVVSSQAIGGVEGARVAPADPLRVPARLATGARRLEGTWLYGGHWSEPVGSFVTETLTTLWPDDCDGAGGAGDPAVAGVRGLVFHAATGPFRGVGEVRSDLLALAGWGGLPVEVVEDDVLVADRLLVPGRSLVVNGWAWPEARVVWRRVAAAAGGPALLDPDGPRVLLSSGTADTDHDRTLQAAGFDVVRPDTLGATELVRLLAGASVLAGANSALHVSAFAPPGVRVLVLGGHGSDDVRLPTQRVVGHVCEHPTAHLPADLPADLSSLGL
ncbi:hypothetical protein ABFT23_20835 [Nocardioides sp. C4-1]|uniref:hypothetical protein n=1 Tax=Nocardioides sp. C4-1 TaxID=3151851 RepID=UPI003265BCFF